MEINLVASILKVSVLMLRARSQGADVLSMKAAKARGKALLRAPDQRERGHHAPGEITLSNVL
ncbi:hypothetical protein DZC75_12510 [Pseudomonas parafulva]|uniref:Uncharacterized protein n=1 Tax=Pseudomonas parafulva TaxID=157782 RepID=A0AAI8KBP7_9PSED|nr:hypothetical protein DZC75_12510 [Pseudomonas parafulva]